MQKEQTNANYIFSPFIIVMALLFYQLSHDPFAILFGLMGVYGLICALYVDKGYNSKLFLLFVLLIFSFAAITLIYLFLTTFNNPARHLLAIFVIIVFICLVTYMALNIIKAVRKISQFDKGARLLDQHHYKEAFDYFDEILLQEPNNPLIRVGKASALQKLGKKEEASKFIENALDPQLHNFLLGKKSLKAVIFKTVGVFYSDLEDYETALEYTDQSLKLNRTLVNSLINRGFILGKLGRIEDSLQCFNKALRYNPKSAHALINKGSVSRKLGKYQEGLEYAEKALTINPKIPDFWLAKGKILMCMDENEGALNAVNEALKLDPDYEDAKKAKDEILSKR